MKNLIWTLPTRIFHWLLLTGFTITFLTGDMDSVMSLHYSSGVFIGLLILLRIIFGFIGPRYSNFKDFNLNIKSLKNIVNNYKSVIYPGHNPLAALIITLALIAGVLCAFSGYIIYLTENKYLQTGVDHEILKEFHGALAYLFLFLIIIHLLGVFIDRILHKKAGTFKSIFSGYKKIETEEAKLTPLQIVFSIFWFLIPVILFYLMLFSLIDKTNKTNNNSEQSERVALKNGMTIDKGTNFRGMPVNIYRVNK